MKYGFGLQNLNSPPETFVLERRVVDIFCFLSHDIIYGGIKEIRLASTC